MSSVVLALGLEDLLPRDREPAQELGACDRQPPNVLYGFEFRVTSSPRGTADSPCFEQWVLAYLNALCITRAGRPYLVAIGEKCGPCSHCDCELVDRCYFQGGWPKA